LLCTLILLPRREFTPAPVDVAASIVTTSCPLHYSDVHRNDGITVTFITDPFGPSFPETRTVSGIHPTLGLDIQQDVDRQRYQLVAMTPGTPTHRLPQWKLCLRRAFLLSVDSNAKHTILDVQQEISLARQAAQTSIIVVFTKDEAKNSLSAVGLSQLYVDQLCVIKAHIAHTV
jgi:hypothetical protein